MHFVITRRHYMDVPDGINIFIFSLAEELIRRGHRVTAVGGLSFEEGNIRRYFGMDAYPDLLSLGLPRSAGYTRTIAEWGRRGAAEIRRLSPDFVIVNGALPAKGRSVFCTVSHDAERRVDRLAPLRRAYKRYAYGKSDHVVATCEEVRESISAELHLEPSRVPVIPTCVRPSNYEGLPLRDREPAILHMGTVGYKNPLATLRAFAALRSDGATCYVTGKPTDELNQFVRSLPASVRGRVELLGFVSAERLRSLLGLVRVVSVPSIYESPVASPTVIEALASGTPVVASPSISRDVLTDGGNGCVRDPANREAVATAFQKLLEGDEDWARLSAQCSVTAKRFSAANVADAYIRLAQGHAASSN